MHMLDQVPYVLSLCTVYRDFMTCIYMTHLSHKYMSQGNKIPPYKYPGKMFILSNSPKSIFFNNATSEIISI